MRVSLRMRFYPIFRAIWEGRTVDEIPSRGRGCSEGAGRPRAAALGGRAVYFQIGGPWTQRVHLDQQSVSAGARASQALILVLHFFILGGCLLLARLNQRLNLRLNRGDWKGGLRVSGFIVATVMLAWLFHAPHVLSVNEEWQMFIDNGGLALFIATYFWLSYIAMEPYLRSRWAYRLVSWNRLLAGRLTDPLVGRDVLAGCLGGLGWALLVELQNLTPGWLGLPPSAPLSIAMPTLMGFRGYLASFFEFQPNVIVNSVAYMVLILLFQVILGKQWIAVGLFFLLMTARLTLQADHLPSGLVYSALIVILWPVMMQRFGLLALMATCNVRILWNFPITSDLSSWYSGGSIFALAVAAALALYGFRTALGDRPLFTRLDLQP